MCIHASGGRHADVCSTRRVPPQWRCHAARVPHPYSRHMHAFLALHMIWLCLQVILDNKASTRLIYSNLNMSRDSARHQRLLGVLEHEASKMGPVKGRPPPMFRETMMDTHQTGSAEQFNAAYYNAPFTAQKYGRSAMTVNNINTLKKKQAGKQRKDTGALADVPVEYQSVFKPRPEQEHVCSMAREHRDRVAGSEWALLDTLEVQMYLHDREARARKVKAQQAATHQALDGQMLEVQHARQREEAERQLERTVLEDELERYKRDQAYKESVARQRNTAMRKEREDMLLASRAAKQQAVAAKKAEEAAELQAVAKQLEHEHQRAVAKLAANRAAMDEMRRDNDARIAARKAAELQQKAADEALMQQTLATLERQEREREEKLKAFMNSVAERANRAGQQVVAENREREAREQRLIAQAEAQKEAQYKAKEAALAAKKQKQKDELHKARADYLQSKAEKEAAAKEQRMRELHEAEDLAAAEAAAHARRMGLMKERTKTNQDFVKTQMVTRERQNVLDDTSMSDREKELNARLLNQAVRIVGHPQQYSVKLF